MIVFEFKVKGTKTQDRAIDEAIRTAQFVQNKCLRYWMDNEKVNRAELYRYNTELRANFPFVKDLNSHATQASVERCWSAIARFYDNCKRKVKGKKGYPKFKKNCRSVEYKTSGWKLLSPKRIQFTDKKGIGTLKLIGTWDLGFYSEEQIKRVRLVKRADGYYCQFILSVDVKVKTEPTNNTIGLDVGLESFYTDDQGNKVKNPRFLRKGEKKLKKLQKRLSKKQKGSVNRGKARQRLSKAHLRISRQRKEYAKRVAYCVIHSNDVVVYEDLRVRNLVKNHCLAKSINDVAWYQFREWLEYFGRKYGKITIAVPPHYTSQNCSNCGKTVKKSLSTRTHVCSCGCVLDRDENAAKNILRIGLSTVGHTGTQACGDSASTLLGAILSEQVGSVKQESPFFSEA
jgi:putative transposase